MYIRIGELFIISACAVATWSDLYLVSVQNVYTIASGYSAICQLFNSRLPVGQNLRLIYDPIVYRLRWRLDCRGYLADLLIRGACWSTS